MDAFYFNPKDYTDIIFVADGWSFFSLFMLSDLLDPRFSYFLFSTVIDSSHYYYFHVFVVLNNQLMMLFNTLPHLYTDSYLCCR